MTHPMSRSVLVVLTGILLSASGVGATEIVIYGFEDGQDGWVIPDWAKASADYVGKELEHSPDQAEEGAAALKFWADFPAERWTGAYVERQVEVTDWSPFSQLSVSIYLPPGAPSGLEGKLILTVGEQWQWTEMNRTIPLAPGSWTTLSVDLKPSSKDWKVFPDEAFRKEVHRLGVRIESNRGPAYSGPVFVDNIRLAD